MSNLSPIACVGVVVLRGDEVLIVRRKNPPNAGAWSIPGGRIEPGEAEETAVHRELMEETGITATITGKITTLDVSFDGVPFRLHDYAAVWSAGEPIAGDDASEARFIHRAHVDDYIEWDKTRDVIKDALRISANAKI